MSDERWNTLVDDYIERQRARGVETTRERAEEVLRTCLGALERRWWSDEASTEQEPRR